MVGKFKIVLILSFSLLMLNGYATKRYWLGTTTSWNTGSNWSLTSGGTPGSVVPGSSDSVYFTAGGSHPCYINTNATCKRFEIVSGFSDSVKQTSTFTLTVGTSGMILGSGIFAGGAGNISNSGVFTLSGCTFISTSLTLSITGDYSFTSGTFTHNGGRVKFLATMNITGNTSFYDLEFSPSVSPGATYTLGSSTALTVNNTLTYSGTSTYWIKLNAGTIDVKGNITSSNTSTAGDGTTVINVNGSGNQVINGVGSTVGAGRLPSIVINKSTGKLTLKNTVSIAGDFTCSSPIDTASGSTLAFMNGTHAISVGKIRLNNLTFTATSANAVNNMTSGDTISVAGALRFDGTFQITVNTGTINAMGDITVTNTYVSTGGSGFVHICGNAGNQTFTGSGVSLGGNLCNVYIDKPSDTLKLSSIISIATTSTWKYIQGIVAAGSSTCTFGGGSTINGGTTSLSMKFNNVRIQGGTTSVLAGPLNVKGSLYIEGARALNAVTYDIKLGGNWDNNGTFTSGTGKLAFVGAGAQYLLHPTTAQGFQNVEINKPSGKLYLYNATMNVNNSLTLTKGIIAGSSTKIVYFQASGATLSGGSDSSYISGAVKKLGNTAFTFPLGDTVLSVYGYHPLTITAPSVGTDAFTAQYYAARYVDTTQVDSIRLSKCEYWTIARNAGSSNVKTTLGWNANNCLTTNTYDMIVAGWDNSSSTWKSLESTSTVITGSTGTVTASATPFWNSTNPVPVMVSKKKAISVTEYIREPYCFTGTSTGFVHLGIKYGAPPFTYVWSNAATTKDINTLTAGTYSLTITDRKSRTFTKSYTLENCVTWNTLPSGLSSDTTGLLHKSTGDSTWAAAESALIIDTLQTGRWIKFTVADTTSGILLGFGPVAADSTTEATNLMMFLDGKTLTVIETDNDGFYSKQQIGTVAIGDVLKVQMDETAGILYYKNDIPIYTGKLLSNARLHLTATLYGSGKNIKKIRCSSN